MSSDMEMLLIISGALFVSILCIAVIFTIAMVILELIKNLYVRYKIRTRYNKKPTAKCYCRDCKKFNPETGECGDPCNGRRMGPSWFCCFADPIDTNIFLKRKGK